LKTVVLKGKAARLLKPLAEAENYTLAVTEFMNRKSGAFWPGEVYGSDKERQRDTITSYLRSVSDDLRPLFVEVILRGEDVVVRDSRPKV
jgi:hypothetical protein